MQETLKANPYVYADNDTVNETDPSGKVSQKCLAALAAAFIGSLVGLGDLGLFAGVEIGGVTVETGITGAIAGVFAEWTLGAFTLSGGASVIAAIGAAVGTLVGPILLIALGVVLIYAAADAWSSAADVCES